MIGIDRDWIINTYSSQGFSSTELSGELNGWDGGSPALGDAITATWNYEVIRTEYLLVLNKAGMAQTGGHEYFHGIQEKFADNKDHGGGGVSSWVWEGNATFVGLQQRVILVLLIT